MLRISFDKFKILLTFKLSGLRTKRIFTPYGELIAGRKGGFSVSATVCENKELALKRITFKLHKLNFVVGEDNKEEIELQGKKVVFCNPEDFIRFFKNKFGFKVSPREVVEYDIIEKFIESFEDKTEALAILNSMYLLYVYREFPEVFIHTKDTRVRMEIEPDIPLLEKVKNLGYGFSHPKTRHPKVRMNYLTDDGREIARSVFEHKLRKSLPEIETLIEKFGRRKIFFMTSGTLQKDGMYLKVRESDSGMSLKGDTTPNILSRLYISDKSLFKELKDVQTPIQLMSRFITLFAIYDEAVKFFSELEKMGFAIKSKIFSIWGVELGTAYRAPLELAEFLMEQCYFELEDEVVEKFVNLFTGMYLKAIEGVAGERMLNELFMGLDIEPIDVKKTSETSQLEMAELVSSILSENQVHQKLT
jgi:hypothetical protein